jgi:ABC-type branched-subunit amino acid transport system substrate-binding protein
MRSDARNHTETFDRAKRYYTAGMYDSTISIIRGYLKKHSKDKPTEYIVPLLMEALLRKDDYKTFGKLYNIYLRRFPESKYLPRLFYLNGIANAERKEYKKAIIFFSDAISKGVSRSLDSLALLNVEKICETYITLGELKKMPSRFDVHDRVAVILLYYRIKLLYESGQTSKAERLASKYKSLYARTPYQEKIKDVFSASKGFLRRILQIGLLAPLTGDNADIGKYAVHGIQLAVENYNKDHSPKIRLIISDTRGNMVETALKTREMIDVHKVQVILGPMLSSNATVAASILMEKPGVVMVSPTATDDGIAGLGDNVFQLNVTLGVLGKKIARYAIESLYIKEFAIITPMTEYGTILSSKFKEEAARLGGEVVIEEFFDEGTNDFRKQFESIRLKLAERYWEKLALDGQLKFGESARDRKKKESYLADSTIEIGGLFIPAESGDITKIASQVYFHRLRTQLLGSNGWHTNSTILDGKKYVNNAIFSTSFEIDVQNEKWIAFSNMFEDRFKQKPDHIVAPLGYDAANIILTLIEKSKSGKSIINQLRSVKDYNGISGTVSLDNPEGINSEAAILKISNRKFLKIQ